MTMRVLMFGGVPIVYDEARNLQRPYINIHGFFEIKHEHSDLTVYAGKAVKVLKLPVIEEAPVYRYKVIVPVRSTEEVFLSRYFNKRQGNNPRVWGIPNEEQGIILKEGIDHARAAIMAAIKGRPDMELLEIPFHEFGTDTLNVCQRIKDFIGADFSFDVEKAALGVDKNLCS